jgi:ribonuclease Z
LTLDPPKPRTYAFCSDTLPSDRVAEIVKGVDLLYHEATFTNEHILEAELSSHSTAAQAAEIAQKAGVGRLLLGHFSGRYKDEAQHLAEAQAVFKNVSVATEGAAYQP